jgi:lipoprotein-anchoring transpeptidase ErfK/SrfK
MTLNQNQPGLKSSVPVGRPRSLAGVITAGVVVMVLLIVIITFLLFQVIFLKDRSELVSLQTVPIAQLHPTLDQAASLQSQPLATEAGTQIKISEPIKPTATQASAYVIQPKKVIVGSPQNRPRWTATPLPTNTPSPTPSPIPTFVSDDSYSSLLRPGLVSNGEKWIDVNLTSQTLVAFEGNAPVFQSLVSSGTEAHPTVTGQFRIWLRFSSQDMNGRRLGYDYFLKDVPYVQYFYQDYALHGTFWHNNFGTPMSHGCVNLPTPSAEWLFNWANNGTLVNVHN